MQAIANLRHRLDLSSIDRCKEIDQHYAQSYLCLGDKPSLPQGCPPYLESLRVARKGQCMMHYVDRFNNRRIDLGSGAFRLDTLSNAFDHTVDVG